MQNPLFPPDEDPATRNAMLGHHSSTVSPNPAADLIRNKLSAIYAEEPSAKQELAEVKAEDKPLSPHQVYIQRLQTSGKSLVQIQTEWHNYYARLSDEEKHQVWQEFYENYNQDKKSPSVSGQLTPVSAHLPRIPTDSGVVVGEHLSPAPAQSDQRSIADVRRHITKQVQAGARGKLKTKHHLQSLAFGLGLGLLAVLIFLFGFFNEVIIAPFIQPSRHVSATPLIVTANGLAATPNPEVIVPKINVEAPVDYSQTTDDENVIEGALNSGVVHYPGTVLPGQNGNAAFFGHSANNIFNPGKYKFIFVDLHLLTVGDTFYLDYNSKVYVYQVISRQIVPPSDVGVLGSVAGQTATATLITCDPPGTSLNRLVVVGTQVSPNPASNTTATAGPTSTAPPTKLPGNGPTLWGRFWHWLL